MSLQLRSSPPAALTVAALAAEVGISGDTVRYYERSGLLPEPKADAAS